MDLNYTVEDGEIFSPIVLTKTAHTDICGKPNRVGTKDISITDLTNSSSTHESTVLDISHDPMPLSPEARIGSEPVIEPFTPFGDPYKRRFGPSRRTPFIKRKSFLNTPKSQRKPTTVFTKVVKRLKKTFCASKHNLKELLNKRRHTPKPKSITKEKKRHRKPRPIVVDGSNIAMGFGKELTGQAQFSCAGIEKCVHYLKHESPFKYNRHKIIVVVPEFRLKAGKSIGTNILHKLSRKGIVKFTPGGTNNGRHYSCYDDNFIVKYAHETGGIIISNDKYRDLKEKKPEWTSTIDNRRLEFKWFGKKLMFPDDPKGKFGPDLADFIIFPDAESKENSP